jgi:hypothetical protein
MTTLADLITDTFWGVPGVRIVTVEEYERQLFEQALEEAVFTAP